MNKKLEIFHNLTLSALGLILMYTSKEALSFCVGFLVVIIGLIAFFSLIKKD